MGKPKSFDGATVFVSIARAQIEQGRYPLYPPFLGGLIGCQVEVSVVKEDHNKVQFRLTPNVFIPTREDLEDVFPGADEIRYVNCEPPPRNASVLVPHIFICFEGGGPIEQIPDTLQRYCAVVKWTACQSQDPFTLEHGILLWPANLQDIRGVPDADVLRILLGEPGATARIETRARGSLAVSYDFCI